MSGTRQGYPLAPPPHILVLKVLVRAARERKIKVTKTGKWREKSKHPCWQIYIKNPKHINTLLELINPLSEAPAYKINIQKQQHFYTPTVILLREKSEWHSQQLPENIRVRLTKKWKNRYDEHCKILMTKLSRKQKDRTIVLAMQSEARLQIQCNPHQYPNDILL